MDGRDKPGHDGKWHGKQDLTSLFLVSAATRLPQRSERDLRPKPIYNTCYAALAPAFRALLAPRSYPRARGSFCALVVSLNWLSALAKAQRLAEVAPAGDARSAFSFVLT